MNNELVIIIYSSQYAESLPTTHKEIPHEKINTLLTGMIITTK